MQLTNTRGNHMLQFTLHINGTPSALAAVLALMPDTLADTPDAVAPIPAPDALVAPAPVATEAPVLAPVRRRAPNKAAAASAPEPTPAPTVPPLPTALEVSQTPPLPIGDMLQHAPTTLAVPSLPPLPQTEPEAAVEIVTSADFMQKLMMPASARAKQLGVPFSFVDICKRCGNDFGVKFDSGVDYQTTEEDLKPLLVSRIKEIFLEMGIGE
jgi:hypothetical protein